MPITPLTTANREIAERMQKFTELEGNLQVVRRMVYEDSVQVDALRQALMDAGAGAPLVQTVADALYDISNAGDCNGNIHFHQKIAVSGAGLLEAVEFIEGLP